MTPLGDAGGDQEMVIVENVAEKETATTGPGAIEHVNTICTLFGI